MSERRMCGLLGIHRTTLRYKSIKANRDEEERQRLKELAGIWKRYGYRRLHILMRREGYEINHKKVYRLYREENLMVRKRKKKRVSQPRLPEPVAADRTSLRWHWILFPIQPQ